jgi:hypothetical protein
MPGEQNRFPGKHPAAPCLMGSFHLHFLLSMIKYTRTMQKEFPRMKFTLKED